MVLAEDCWHRSLTSLMAEIRELMKDRPVYLTFDIDGIDPTYCPGTGESWIIQLTNILYAHCTCNSNSTCITTASKSCCV